VDVIEGSELPPKEEAMVHVCIGPYILKSDKTRILNGRAEWYQSLTERKVVFPEFCGEDQQIPDIILYFTSKDAEEKRLTFCRLK